MSIVPIFHTNAKPSRRSLSPPLPVRLSCAREQRPARLHRRRERGRAQISQGCAEIRWLALAAHGRPETVAGLSGFADIMLTCYGALSRNRQVGIRLGQGETIQDIVASSTQVAEGVATAGSVVALARRYHVSLPVLTAVAAALGGDCSIEEAVQAVIDLPQLEER
jgi:glycerol-3-phosphate dehydrogenase (NAD+)